MVKKRTWKPVYNYEGIYEVSNDGLVKSLDRFVIRKNGRKQPVKGRIKKQFPNPIGYLVVGLSKNGVHITRCVHQLVCESFLGHRRDGMNSVVNHIDNNKLNNKIENLEITTNRHNSTCHRENGTSKYPGVHFCSRAQRWIVKTQVDGISVYLGSFNDEEKAGIRYKEYHNI